MAIEGGSGRVRRGPTNRHYGGINFCMYNAAGESLLYVCERERARERSSAGCAGLAVNIVAKQVT